MHRNWILVAALLGLGLGPAAMPCQADPKDGTGASTEASTVAGAATGKVASTVASTAASPAARTVASTAEGTVSIWERGPQGGKSVVQDRSNAVVFLAGFEPGVEAGFPAAQQQMVLAQTDKSFSARVLAIAQGESVVFPNQDPFHHNVWSKSKARPFDLGLYKAPESRSVDFPQPGIVTVFCNIHPQMIATILVLPNRKFALTTASGAYRIEGIPAGRYAVFAWVEGAEPVRQVLEFDGAGLVRADFTLQIKRIPINHLDKDGKPYRKGPAEPRYNAEP